MVRKSLRDRKKSLYLFALVFVVYSVIYMTKNCYSAALASIVAEGIMTKSETGLISAAFYLIYAPFQIVGGIAADRHSPHKLILFGTVGAGICNLLVYFFSQNYIAMLIIWSLNAIVQFGVWPSVFKIMSSQLCEGHRTRAVFYISFTSTLGLVLSYVCAALITDWRLNFLLSAIALFLSATVFFLVYRRIQNSMSEECDPAISVEKSKKKIEKGALSLIIKAGIPLLLVVYTVLGVLNSGLKSLAPVMLMENYETLTPALANLLNIILVLASSVGFLFSRVPFLKKISEPVAITAMFAITTPLLFALTFIGEVNLAFIIAALALFMVAVSSMIPFFAYISKNFERFGLGATLAGLFNCMQALGIVLANYVFAKLVEMFGWEFATKSWLLLAIAALALTAITIPLWRKFKNDIEA